MSDIVPKMNRDELIALIHEMRNTQIDQIEGIRKAERCIKTLIEACKDSEARTERAEARVKGLELDVMSREGYIETLESIIAKTQLQINGITINRKSK